MNVDMSVYDDFFKVVDLLISINNRRRKDFEHLQNDFSLYQWLEEFGAVKVDAGRNTGKSFYISKRMNYEDDIVIVHSRFMKNNFREQIYESIFTLDEIAIFTLDEIATKREALKRRMKVSRIYIDEPSLVARKIYAGKILETILPLCNYDTTIIYLGA